MSTAAKVTEIKRKGMNRTRRRSTTAGGPAGEFQITVPTLADNMLIENIGTVEISFTFGADSFAESWKLQVGERTPGFTVNKDTLVNIRSSGAIGEIQYMLWG